MEPAEHRADDTDTADTVTFFRLYLCFLFK